MSRAFRLALLATAACLFALAVPSAAQQTVKHESIQPISDISGAATFNAYCTVCHGTSGKGDGPAAQALTRPPADLSQLAKRSNGKFPALSVRMAITGETTLAAHGTRDMPMWGPVFRSVEGGSVSELRVRNLVNYIELLQQK